VASFAGLLICVGFQHRLEPGPHDLIIGRLKPTILDQLHDQWDVRLYLSVDGRARSADGAKHDMVNERAVEVFVVHGIPVVGGGEAPRLSRAVRELREKLRGELMALASRVEDEVEISSRCGEYLLHLLLLWRLVVDDRRRADALHHLE